MHTPHQRLPVPARSGHPRSDVLRSSLLRSGLLRSGLLRSGLLRSGRLHLALLCSGVLAMSAAAQETGEPARKPRPSREAKLRAACEAMSGLDSLRFTTRHRTLNRALAFVVRGAGKQKFRAVTTSGTSHGDLLKIEIGDADQLLFRGRRMIAADDTTDWTLRRGKRADGSPLTFALDPVVLFTALAGARFEVRHHGVGTVRQRPVETHTIRLAGDAARDLFWSGGIPGDDGKLAGGNAAGVVAFQAFRGIAGGAVRALDMTIDLAISFDPATRQILRIHGRTYTDGNQAGLARGRMIINGARLGQGGAEEEEEEKDAAEPGSYVNGLEVPAKSKMKKSTVVEFTFDFMDHDAAPAPQLDGRARKLLGYQTVRRSETRKRPVERKREEPAAGKR